MFITSITASTGLCKYIRMCNHTHLAVWLNSKFYSTPIFQQYIPITKVSCSAWLQEQIPGWQSTLSATEHSESYSLKKEIPLTFLLLLTVYCCNFTYPTPRSPLDIPHTCTHWPKLNQEHRLSVEESHDWPCHGKDTKVGVYSDALWRAWMPKLVENKW